MSSNMWLICGNGKGDWLRFDGGRACSLVHGRHIVVLQSAVSQRGDVNDQPSQDEQV